MLDSNGDDLVVIQNVVGTSRQCRRTASDSILQTVNITVIVFRGGGGVGRVTTEIGKARKLPRDVFPAVPPARLALSC